MLCVSIANSSEISVIETIKKYPMAEVRLDALNTLNSRIIREIFSSHDNLIATLRPCKIEEKDRINLLIEAVNFGAKYVDIEIETDISLINKIQNAVNKNNCKLIISYHNYKKTPTKEKLTSIVDECKKLNADIVKIATFINKKEDNATILSLYGIYKNIIAIGMGNSGKITRVASVLCGAPFTFAAENNKLTAPGQLNIETFKTIYSYLKNE
jgi:3-dehydroquinate dehydratase type I